MITTAGRGVTTSSSLRTDWDPDLALPLPVHRGRQAYRWYGLIGAVHPALASGEAIAARANTAWAQAESCPAGADTGAVSAAPLTARTAPTAHDLPPIELKRGHRGVPHPRFNRRQAAACGMEDFSPPDLAVEDMSEAEIMRRACAA